MLSFRIFWTVQQLDQTVRPESFSLYEELIGNCHKLVLKIRMTITADESKFNSEQLILFMDYDEVIGICS